MTCLYCMEFEEVTHRKHNTNTFTVGCKNWRLSANRFGNRLQTSTWMEIYDHDFPLVMSLADILLCIPPTSVRCETTFSHMKLIKTCRRTKMSGSTLSNLLLVKLESDCVENFCPDDAVHIWMNQSVRRRKINYKRAKRDIQEKVQAGTVVDSEAVNEEELVEAEEETISDDILAYEISCWGDEGDEYFEDFMTEETNWMKICEFLREE